MVAASLLPAQSGEPQIDPPDAPVPAVQEQPPEEKPSKTVEEPETLQESQVEKPADPPEAPKPEPGEKTQKPAAPAPVENDPAPAESKPKEPTDTPTKESEDTPAETETSPAGKEAMKPADAPPKEDAGSEETTPKEATAEPPQAEIKEPASEETPKDEKEAAAGEKKPADSDNADDEPVAEDDASEDVPPAWSTTVRWRELGPTSMGGRICDIAVVSKNPTTFFVGAASGGVFKTTDGGITFDPLFQDAPGISVGAIGLSPSDPNVLYVGTGEPNPRNSVSWGTGVYRSTDGGNSWKNVGLKESFQIGRIVVHPTDPNTAFVGALGRLWGPGGERGLFKTTDGGKTWTNVLTGEGGAGAIDVAFKPGDPSTLLATTYERLRGPYDTGDPDVRFGPGSALWRSTDGGETWEEIEEGLPTCDLGRIGLSWHEADPSIVFAVVESEQIGTAPKGAKRPALMGIRGEDQSAADRKSGALLTQVTDDGPAFKAGLRTGDRVVKIADEKVETYAGLIRQIRKRYAGDTVTVEAIRGDDERVMGELTFGARGGGGSRPYGGRLGGQVANIQAEQGENGFETGGVYRSDDAGRSWTR
ncbi:MAG: PDZ domain-containing protein, partial [Planctomycetota bacterium]